MRHVGMTSVFLMLGALTVSAGDPAYHTVTAAADDPRFEFLKGLAGTWVGSTDHDETGQGIFEFRVTSGGTAVQEREMIGSPMEMLTVYNMQDKDLVATHYCVLGNQPRAVAARRVTENTLSFRCNGTPGNADSHDDKHVHGWTMRLDGPDRLVYDAEIVENGEAAEAPSFVLTRQATTARR